MTKFIINKYNKEDFYSNDPNYRLADCIYGWVRQNIRDKKFHLENYPNSIGSLYIKETDNKQYLSNGTPYVDHTIFYNIVNKRLKDVEKKVNIHIRIGDAFIVKGAYNLSIEELGKVGSDYVQPLSFYKKIANKLKENNINKVQILAGIHNKPSVHSIERSIEYLKKIETILNEKEIKFDYILGGDPDKVFCIIANSKIFIPGGGGFSRLAKHIVRRNNGQIWDSELGYF